MPLLDYIKKYKILDFINRKLQCEFDLFLKIGVELEFYLIKDYRFLSEMSCEDIVEIVKKKFSLLIEPEMGKDQYEIILKPSVCISQYAEYIENLKIRLFNFCKNLGFIILFDAKPFKGDFGNAMHVNLSCNNFFHKNILIANILCSYVSMTKRLFFFEILDYERLDYRFMSPTHICVGSSHNRTALIRILYNRLEHRLASSNVNSYQVFYAILVSILRGLKYEEEIKEFPIIYGNAFDEEYDLAII
ncbi:MAG: hypothetical protein ISN64_03305 [Rickettsia sp.]|nr:hypothetical protein [Rickettsia sp.]